MIVSLLSMVNEVGRALPTVNGRSGEAQTPTVLRAEEARGQGGIER